MTAKKTTLSTLHPDYAAEILSVLRSNLTPRLLRDRLSDYHENDLSAAMDLLRREERTRLYSILDSPLLAEVLAYSEHQHEYLAELSVRRQVEVLALWEPATTAAYLHQLDKTARSTLLELLPEEVRHEVTLLSSFDDDEIGSRMSTNYVAISADLTIRQAMRELIRQAADNDNISTLYVVDGDETLLGAIDLKDLIIAREGTPLSEIIMTSYPYVYASELIEDCIERLKDYSEDAIPVLDSDNRLTGVLTAQELTELIDRELGEDYARLAGLSAGEDLEEPLRQSIRKRLPWLIVLLGLGLVVSSVVGIFEHIVSHLALIVCFQSLVLDMAGNVGTQSLAVTIRVLMDDRVTPRQKRALVGKEARIGLLNGLMLCVLSCLLIGVYLMLFKQQPPLAAFAISLCTGVALLVAMLLSSICGTIVPITFKKLHIDPAVASGPLITTINDLIAVVTYYGLAWLLLMQLLHL